ncbi:MAG: BadF/BadG/BcrA/BcrD ATPase family protein [Balneola sp.]
MNILIADSGSTKTEWVLVNEKGEKKYCISDGLNPYFRTFGQLSEAIRGSVKKDFYDLQIDRVYFYGSGSGNESRKAILGNAIRENFAEAEINIESDLLGAAIACFGKEKGIACILGTGSNSCVYNGTKIEKGIPSLGFVLGDEGSGGYFGKRILNGYYYKTMPEDLRKAIEETSDMALEGILHKVYEEPQANRFVASFSKILGTYKDHPYIQEMVRKGFEAFADKQLAYFDESKWLGIGFVGSIASVYQNILVEVLSERNMRLSVVIRKPLERLIEFHQENLN